MHDIVSRVLSQAEEHWGVKQEWGNKCSAHALIRHALWYVLASKGFCDLQIGKMMPTRYDHNTVRYGITRFAKRVSAGEPMSCQFAALYPGSVDISAYGPKPAPSDTWMDAKTGDIHRYVIEAARPLDEIMAIYEVVETRGQRIYLKPKAHLRAKLARAA